MKNILFICSRNQWRSPTAEKVWQNHPKINTRSAGTSSKARNTVSNKDIDWADIIFVMEDKHKKRLEMSFLKLLKNKKLIVLHIADDYKYMNAELVEMLKTDISFHLGIEL